MKNHTAWRGLGLADVLLVVFVILKLCGVISWRWVWVLSPLWAQMLVYAGALFAEIYNIYGGGK